MEAQQVQQETGVVQQQQHNDVTVHGTPKFEKVTEEYLWDYLKNNITYNLTQQQANEFVSVALAYNLNPVKREIYCIPFGNKINIVTGYETYLKRAERLKVLDGWKVNCVGSQQQGDLRAKITIYRKDWSHPFEHEVFLIEYKQDTKIWKSKPFTMIRKVVISQGFRLCFPDEFGGMPYTDDEMSPDRDVTPPEQTVSLEEPPPQQQPPNRQVPPQNQRPPQQPKKPPKQPFKMKPGFIPEVAKQYMADLDVYIMKIGSDNITDVDKEKIQKLYDVYQQRKGMVHQDKVLAACHYLRDNYSDLLNPQETLEGDVVDDDDDIPDDLISAERIAQDMTKEAS